MSISHSVEGGNSDEEMPLFVRRPWVHKRTTREEVAETFHGIPCIAPTGIPPLRGTCHRYILSNGVNTSRRTENRKRLQVWPEGMPLFVPSPWVHKRVTREEFAERFQGIIPSIEPTGIPPLAGVRQRYILSNGVNTFRSTENRKRLRGWPGPGPGPKIGMKKLAALENIGGAVILALISLVKEALKMHSVFPRVTGPEQSCNVYSEADLLSIFARLEANVQVYPSIRKKMWPLHTQLGVPSFLMKLTSPNHAIAMYLVSHTTGPKWCCSKCTTSEVDLIPSCEHSDAAKKGLDVISNALGYSSDYVIGVLNHSAQFQQLSELSSVCFYGEASKPEFAVVRSGFNAFSSPVEASDRVHVVRIGRYKKWSCLGRSCDGISRTCYHSKLVQDLVSETAPVPLLSMFDRDKGAEPGHASFEDTSTVSARYGRPMIPSNHAFDIDSQVNLDARNGGTKCISASRTCHCGCILHEGHQTTIYETELRVEASRCYVTYKQEIWVCKNGHTVLPEEEECNRDGLVWVSKDTAYTEVFLFDILLHMTFSGSPIATQAEIRSQLLSLQLHYVTAQEMPRSHLCLRKALIIYAMSVVKDIPDWVFRCQKCAEVTSDGVYYDKLSFDGQQLGFNIRHDVRYDFYGRKLHPWSRPVQRCSKAWQTSHIIESQSMRCIVTESLRVREVPVGCNSVHSLCRLMMNISLHNKDSIRDAVAAIKMFDKDWVHHVPQGHPVTDDTNFHAYVETYNAEFSSHPIHLISTGNSIQDFNRGHRVMDVFRHVVDATKASSMLSVLLQNLRGDLKALIPIHDSSFLENYSQLAYEKLHLWLLELNRNGTEDTQPGMPAVTMKELFNMVKRGIPEHAEKLAHPYRPPWAWIQHSSDMTGDHLRRSEENMVCKIYDAGPWKCPGPATSRVLLMVMALFNDPICVWLRNGTFRVVNAAIDVLVNAEQYCGRENTAFHYRAAFHDLKDCVLLYEGIMAIIGADVALAGTMFSCLRRAFECVLDKYELYEHVMDGMPSRKPFTFCPTEFDDMLLRTGAIRERNDEVMEAHSDAILRMSYEQIAQSQSTDFLETGVWAPDFPIRRPSPADLSTGTNTTLAEGSCSKNFKVDSAFSPGTFGGYCLCKHVKTVLLMFLKKPEGCRMPLNFIVERCSRLPRYMVYDFACGTHKAALGMSKEIVRNTNFVIDPFHFPGHKTCSLAMHQSSYSDLFGCNTESQEQRNRGIKVMDKTLRGCRDIHFMHFVVLAHAYLNLKSMFQDHHDENTTRMGSRAWIRWVRDNLFSSRGIDEGHLQ